MRWRRRSAHFAKAALPTAATRCRNIAPPALKLVIAAIVYWNSTYMSDGVNDLRASGTPVSDNLLRHTSPVGWEHIAFSGNFLQETAAQLPTGRLRLNATESQRSA